MITLSRAVFLLHDSFADSVSIPTASLSAAAIPTTTHPNPKLTEWNTITRMGGSQGFFYSVCLLLATLRQNQTSKSTNMQPCSVWKCLSEEVNETKLLNVLSAVVLVIIVITIKDE